MIKYWLAQNGETKGPFAEAQILQMWENGQVLDTDMVCEEGSEEWMTVEEMKTVVSAFEKTLPAVAGSARSFESTWAQRQAEFDREKKSALIAFLISWLFPGVGVIYAGRVGIVIGLFVLTLIGVVTGLMPLVIVGLIAWALSPLLAIVAVGDYNRTLAKRLGL